MLMIVSIYGQKLRQTKSNLGLYRKRASCVHKYQQLISDCFWEYNFTSEDLDQIITSGDPRKNQFIFGKILANSTYLLKDLKIFPLEKLASLVDSYTVPKFNYDFLYRRKNIVEFHFFEKDLTLEELKWTI